MQSTIRNLSCSVRLDLDLLKQWRVSAAAAARDDYASPPVKHMSQQQPSQVRRRLEYAYSKHHPALQCGAEMNETYGPSTSGRIYQYIPGYANFEILYLHLLGYASL